MSVPARIATFLAGLGVVFGLGFGLGAASGGPDPEPGHYQHSGR